jgi:hypothetical protein
MSIAISSSERGPAAASVRRFDLLLDPKWAGKISWQVPRASGQGQRIEPA